LGRIVFWILIGLLFWLLVKGLLKSRKRADHAPHAGKAEDMVSCARCGVNLPRSEAHLEAGQYICVDNPQCLR
jgi:uncharacterized protein